MSSSLRRGTLAATTLALSIATLSACASGNDSQTMGVKPEHAATTLGDIKLQNIVVVTQPGSDAPGPAVVTGQIFNNGQTAQTLKGVTLKGQQGQVTLSPAKGSGDIVVPAHGNVLLGGKKQASAVIDDGGNLRAGNTESVTFDLSESGDVSVRAFVVPAKGDYREWGPTPISTTGESPRETPSDEVSPQGSESPSGKLTGEATPGSELSGND